jgi:metallo-beta-lactamase family protein
MQLQFFGAVGTVTGSKTLLEHEGRRVLVDCGLFQGVKQLRLRNWEALPVRASSIDAVVLTHAHVDHCGFLPRLVKLGFQGRIHATRATHELCELLLPDCAHLFEEEAEYANRHGFSRHSPALPLFTQEDALNALERFTPCDFDAEFEPAPGLRARMRPAGHLLGAASVRIEAGGRSVLFSGDLGRADDLVMPPPSPPMQCDAVVIESTYGDRLHPGGDVMEALAETIRRTAARGGIVLIPAFAVGRSQALLHAIQVLKGEHRIPDLPVFLNSPMAAGATQLYLKWRALHRLDEAACARIEAGTTIVQTLEESKRLNALKWPSIIVSASGMATGGRVVHHLKAYADDPRNTIVLAGFQAPGTRGAALAAGATSIKIHGEYVPVRAQVVQLDGLSAHADRDGLLAWLRAMPSAPRRVFVNHGEALAADVLRLAVEETLRWPALVPESSRSYEID